MPFFPRPSLSFFLLLAAFPCALHAAAAPATPTAPAAPSAAAPAVEIAVLVAQVVAQNPEIRFYENEIRLARERRDTTGRWSDPELAVEIGRKTAREPGGVTNDGLAWSVTLSQKFDFTGRAALRKAIAEHQAVRAEAGLSQFRHELAAKTAELALVLLAAQRRLEAAEAIAERARALLTSLARRDPAGVAALLETKIIEADILKLAKNAAARRAELLAALAELNLLRGAAPDAPLLLAATDTHFAAAPNNAALFAAALRDNFILRQFESDLAEQGVNVGLEEKNAWGDVTLSPYFSEERAGTLERSVGVGVSIPLPLWNSNKEAVADARSRKSQAETALYKARRDLRRDIIAAAIAYRAAREALLVANPEMVASFRDATELGDRHYRLGTIPVTTYLALQQAYLDGLDAEVSTRVEAIQAASRLTALTGIALEKFVRTTRASRPEASGQKAVAKAEEVKTAPPAHAHDDHDHDHDDHDAHGHEKHGHKHEGATAASGKTATGAGVATGTGVAAAKPTTPQAHDHEKHAHEKHGDAHEGAAAGVTFDAAHGLRLPDATRNALGVRTAKVETRRVSATFVLSARAYAVADGSKRAVAVINDVQAAVLKEVAQAFLPEPAKPAADGKAGKPTCAPLPLLTLTANAATGQREAVFALPPEAPVDAAVVLRVAVPAKNAVLAVPLSAVLDTAAGVFVYRVKEGAYQRTAVKLGAADAEFVEIQTGVSAGEEVVTAAAPQLWLTELRLTKGGGHSH